MKLSHKRTVVIQYCIGAHIANDQSKMRHICQNSGRLYEGWILINFFIKGRIDLYGFKK